MERDEEIDPLGCLIAYIKAYRRYLKRLKSRIKTKGFKILERTTLILGIEPGIESRSSNQGSIQGNGRSLLVRPLKISRFRAL